MFAMPFGRIIWKEYRASRALWLSCLAIGLLGQIWCEGFAVLNHVGHPDHRVDGVMAMVWFIPIMYMVGCCAILFAAEREASTCNWLVTLSAPPLATLSAKLIFAIISTLALQLLLAMTAIGLLLVARVDVSRLTDPGYGHWLLPAGLLVMAWTVLGSLVSRKVIMSVVSMVFWALIPVWLVEVTMANLLQPGLIREGWVQALIIGFVACFTLLADLVIGWKWVRGEYHDGALLEKLGEFVSRSVREQIRSTPASSTTTLPIGIEHERLERRTWQRLVWQEQRRDRFSYYLVAVGVVILTLLVAKMVVFNDQLILMPGRLFGFWNFCISLSFFCSLIVGVFSYQSDAGNQQLRFLANHGVSPNLIWWSKQRVWFVRACALIAYVALGVLVTIIAAYWHLRSAEFLWPIYVSWTGDIHTHLDDPLLRYNGAPFTLTQIFWLALLSYASGQFASILVRRTILAIVLGGLIYAVFGCWFTLIDHLGFSYWWSLGLPFILLMLFIRWQTRPWLMEDDSSRRRLRVAGVMTAFVAAHLTTLCVVRVAEVATWHPLLTAENQSFLLEVQSNADWESHAPSWGSTADEFYDSLQNTKADIPDRVKKLVELLNQNESSVISQDVAMTWARLGANQSLPPYALLKELTGASAKLTEEGQLDEALKYYLATLKVARIVGRGNRQDWYHGTIIQSICLRSLIDWANHPSQTSTKVLQALKTIDAELALYPSLFSAVARTYIQDRNAFLLAPTSKVLDHIAESMFASQFSEPVFFRFLYGFTILSPAERQRFNILVTRWAELDFEEARLLELQYRGWATTTLGVTDPNAQIVLADIESQRKHFDRYLNDTPLLRLTGSVGNPASDALKARYTTVRAGLIRMALIAHRLKYGRLPSQLIELAPTLNAKDLIDPWSGETFEYHPTFLFSPSLWKNRLVFTDENHAQIVLNRHPPNFNPQQREAVWNKADWQNRNIYEFDINPAPNLAKSQSEEIQKLDKLIGSLFPIPPHNGAPINEPPDQ